MRMMAKPRSSIFLNVSFRKIAEKAMVNTIESLSIGTTMLASPICKAK